MIGEVPDFQSQQCGANPCAPPCFIAKNEMTWEQYLDADHNLSTRFGISAIPHYFTIDSDGVLTAEMLGSGSDVEGKLKKLVAKAKAAKAAELATAPVAAMPSVGGGD